MVFGDSGIANAIENLAEGEGGAGTLGVDGPEISAALADCMREVGMDSNDELADDSGSGEDNGAMGSFLCVCFACVFQCWGI